MSSLVQEDSLEKEMATLSSILAGRARDQRSLAGYSLCCAVLSRSVVSDTFRPHGLQLPGSSVHGILQARILEWVAMPFFRGSS